MKLLVTVMSCHKNWHLWKDIKERVKGNLIIFSYSPKNENWFDAKEKILYLKCRDTYECLPEKVVCMIDQILNNRVFAGVTHILKIDDHEALHLTDEKIRNLYSYKEIQKNHYLGQELLSASDAPDSGARVYHYGKVTSNSEWDNRPYRGRFVRWLNGGKTYILSRTAMKCINCEYNFSNLDILYKKEIYEDLMVGKCLYKHKILPVQLNYNIV
jgi:hypothetical protein